jgi:hypothetical protein
VAAFLAFQAVAGGLLLSRDPVRETTPPAGQQSPTPAATPNPRQDAADRSAALRTAAVERLLATRARAIRARDRALFASTLDPFRKGFAKRQQQVFDALRDIPLAEWRYELDPAVTAPPPGGYAGETWAPKVVLHHRIRGYDVTPSRTEQWFTFVRRGDDWVIASDTDVEGDGRRTGRDVWDFGRVMVVHGASSIVLGHAADGYLLRDVARRSDDAVPRVSAVWGTRWPRKVVVVVPSTQDEAVAILGDGEDLSRIAAVAVSTLATDGPAGSRVVVNPANFRRLGPTGRRVVLTHEVTHVATRDAGAVGLPTWVVEGFADYVGYLGTGLPKRLICQELAVDVRAGRVPRALPANDDFDGANPRLAQAYESAWLAVHLIADREGQPALVRFYRRVAGGDPLPQALHDATGLTATEFTRAWRRYVRESLG